MVLPTGTPQAEWDGIQIMAGAGSGWGDEDNYRYTVYATNEEVVDFLRRALWAAGWSPFLQGENPDGSIAMLWYQKDGVDLTIMLTDHPDGMIMIWMMKL